MVESVSERLILDNGQALVDTPRWRDGLRCAGLPELGHCMILFFHGTSLTSVICTTSSVQFLTQ